MKQHTPCPETYTTAEQRLAEISQQFVQRLRDGERPSISEYARAHSELATEIEQLLPVLADLERVADAQAAVERSGHPHAAETMPAQLGEYRLIRLIGQGGMGKVYEAEHSTLRRRVALKVLNTDLSRSPHRMQRFYREARAAGKLHHTNIVPVFEVGSDQSVHFYAMQFIEGCSLDLVIQSVRQLREPATTQAIDSEMIQLAISNLFGQQESTSDAHQRRSADTDDLHYYYLRVANLGFQVAQALQYAHQHDIIHRDIKPANLILDTSGVVWVADFGLATQSDEDLTQTGDLLGTLPYMAPERLQGWTDARADIYALGLTLYELLALQPAFAQRDRASLLSAIVNQQPAPLRSLAASLPADLETIILKAIEKQPELRYASAGALAEDLHAFLNDLPIRARRASLLNRLGRFTRRNPVTSVLLLVVGWLLLTLLFGSTWFGFRWMQQAHELQIKSQLALDNEREALSLLFDQYRREAIAGRLVGSGGQRGAGLAAVDRALKFLPRVYTQADQQEAARLNLRNEAIACLALVDLHKIKTIPVAGDWTTQVAFDWRGQRYAQSSVGGDIQIVDTSTNSVTQRLPGPGYQAWRLEFDPSGQYLAATYHPARESPRQICVWSVNTAQCIVRHDQPNFVGRFAFHPEHQTIAIANNRQEIDIYGLEEGARIETISLQGIEALALCYSPTGDRLVIADAHRPRVSLMSLTARPRQVLSVPGVARDFAWSDDGKWLFMGCESGEIQIVNSWSLDDKPRTLRGHQGAVVRLALNPTGDRLVSCSWDNSTRLWDLVNDRQLMKTENHACLGRFSPDGRHLGYYTPRREFGVWEVFDRSCCQTLTSGATQRFQVGFLAGTSQLLWSHTNQGLEVFDVTTELQLQRIDVPATARFVDSATLSSDGHSLLAVSERGIERWPVHIGTSANGEVVSTTFGAAETLVEMKAEVSFADPVARAGHAVVPWGRGARIINWQNPRQIIITGDHHNRWSLALSPNGQWLATGPWQGNDVCVWNTSHGQLSRRIEFDGEKASVQFSPDSRHLAISTGFTIDLIDTESWQRVRQAHRTGDDGWPARLAFSPDGQMLVAAWSRDLYQILDVKTLETIAILQPPEPGSLGQLALSSDGSRIAILSGQNIHVWQLSQLRQQLAQHQLDW